MSEQTKTVLVRGVTQEVWAQLCVIAGHRQTSCTQVAREAIAEYAKREFAALGVVVAPEDGQPLGNASSNGDESSLTS